ncbi:hypothetical protein WS67_01045 [Burkholderia singularis]|uniref:Uncharacterized protein n=1 Tax=Burkholderia singularis TaxID=1503053 RepID=A0A103DWU5_9BURK|nr:hypothetical protein WS67_01045 [Burkholderia singularis]
MINSLLKLTIVQLCQFQHNGSVGFGRFWRNHRSLVHQRPKALDKVCSGRVDRRLDIFPYIFDCRLQ